MSDTEVTVVTEEQIVKAIQFFRRFGIEIPSTNEELEEEIKLLCQKHPTIRSFLDGNITIKEALWVELYLSNGYNASSAARAAGYKMSNATLVALKSNPKLKCLIAERIKKQCIEADEVLARYKDIAESDMDDFVIIDDEDEFGGRISLRRARNRNKLHLVKRLRKKRDGSVELELHDKMHALDQLARHLNLFEKEHMSVGGGIMQAISELNSEERDARLAKIKELEKKWQEENSSVSEVE